MGLPAPILALVTDAACKQRVAVAHELYTVGGADPLLDAAHDVVKAYATNL